MDAVTKKILIYGDSNSWGYIPASGARYSRDVRWPGVASSELGNDYELVEQCISGRTTIYDDPNTPKRNGYDGIGYAISAGYPFDLVVLFLGTNDLKFTDSEGFRKGITELVRYVKNAPGMLNLEHPIFISTEKILLVGPPFINPEITTYRPQHSLAKAAEESRKLAGIAMEVASSEHTEYIDVSSLVYPDPPDCLHLSPRCHSILGKVLAQKIRQILE